MAFCAESASSRSSIAAFIELPGGPSECSNALEACCPTAFEMMCERPPRSLRSRLPLTRGRLRLQHESFILPIRVRGRAAEGGRGSLHAPSRIGVGQPLPTAEPWATFCRPSGPESSLTFNCAPSRVYRMKFSASFAMFLFTQINLGG
jgi:hypothetical protein